jgi:hypothetical protein
MRHTKRKRRKKAVPVVGAVGVSLSLAGGASAATAVATADMPSRDSILPQITLSEEEIADVSLWADRALLIWLYRRYSRILSAITIVRPETVVRWHRMGFVAYWRWKSGPESSSRECIGASNLRTTAITRLGTALGRLLGCCRWQRIENIGHINMIERG